MHRRSEDTEVYADELQVRGNRKTVGPCADDANLCIGSGVHYFSSFNQVTLKPSLSEPRCEIQDEGRFAFAAAVWLIAVLYTEQNQTFTSTFSAVSDNDQK